MASGREHNLASTVVSAPLGLGIGMILRGQGAPLDVAMRAGLSASAGCLAGILLTPDLDMLTISKSEWLVVRWLPIIGWLWLAIWDIYARLLPHRNALSHLPILGTAGRLVYFGSLAYGLWRLMHQPLLPALPPSEVLICGMIGLLVSDTFHWLMDGCPLHWWDIA